MNHADKRQLAIQAVQKAEQARKSLGIHVLAPVNPIDASLNLGCSVRIEDIPSLEGIYSSEPYPVIILGSQRPSGRRSYTCAHELGHHVCGHGTQIEQLNEFRNNTEDTEIEYLADMFSAFFLMNQLAVVNTLKQRKMDLRTAQPLHFFALASYFGVGYSTILHHLHWSLNLLSKERLDELLSVQPKEIKSRFNPIQGGDVLIVDRHWKYRAADLEIGDFIVLPEGTHVENDPRLEFSHNVSTAAVYRAMTPGLTRAYDEKTEWAVNIRVSRKHYKGLAEYRHLEDEDYE